MSERHLTRWPAMPALWLGAAFWAVSFPLSNRLYSNGLVDISEYLNNAFRVFHGEWPYRDFWLFHPPGEVFLPAALYRLFGVQLNAVLTASVLLNVLAGMLSFAFARQILGENVLAAATAMLVFFNGLPTHAGMAVVDPSGHYFLPLLLGAMALLRYTATSKTPMLFVSGVSVGCASLLRLFDAMPALVAFVAALWMHERTQGSTIRRTVAAIGILAAGIVSVWLAVSVALWPIWPLMMRDITVGALAHHAQFYHSMQTWLPLQWEMQYLTDRVVLVAQTGSPLSMGKLGFWILTFLTHLVLYLLPVVVIAAVVRLGRRGLVLRTDRAVLALLLVWGVGGLAKAAKNPTILYWVTGTTPLIFLLGWLIQRVQPVRMRVVRWALAGTAMVLALAVPMGIATAAFRVLTVSEAIHAPNGSVMVEDAQYARDVRGVLATILDRTQAGDPIFADPYHLPPLYAMTGRRNPSYYDSPQVLFGNRLAGLPTEREERRICGELLSHHTRLVVTDRQPTVGPFRLLQQCLETNFDLASVVGPYALYVAH